jgi:hypothetical protein
VIVLASALNVPDDLLYLPSDGTVITGEHGSGRLAIVGGPSRLKRLPQVIGEAEGIAQIGSTIYVADQLHNRVVALSGSGVRTVIQLQLDPSGLNLDGIAGTGTQLIVPDSPHGTVLLVDPSGHVAARWAGLSRPAGAWGGSTPYLIADENANAIYALKSGGGFTKLAGNLSGVDDVVRDSGSDKGRLDLIVKTFAIRVPAPAVRLLPGQGVCLGITRGKGYTASLAVDQVTGASVTTQPGTSNSFEVLPQVCSAATCTVSLQVTSPAGREFAYFTYRD